MGGLKKEMKNIKGQMLVFNLMLLMIVIVVFMALIPVFQETIAQARGSDGLNCVSTKSICNDGDSEPCYNTSIDVQTTSCLILDIYLPYIIIAVLLLGVGALMGQRGGLFGGMQQQQPAQYGGGY